MSRPFDSALARASNPDWVWEHPHTSMYADQIDATNANTAVVGGLKKHQWPKPYPRPKGESEEVKQHGQSVATDELESYEWMKIFQTD